MGDQEQRQLRMLLTDRGAECSQVLDQSGKARRPEISEAVRVGRMAMSAVVVGVDQVPGRCESLGQPVVAACMLGDSVGDLDDADRRLGGIPQVGGQWCAVGRGGEG
ncbi:hypothetical protein GCM10027061_03360 [Nesterenkonia suensis]